MVLIIGYMLLSLLVLTVVLATSAVYIEHKKLLSVADGAALTAADTFGLDQISREPGSPPVPTLDPASVQTSVTGYLERTAAGARFSGLSVDSSTGAPDSRTARVVLTALVHPPVVNFLVPGGIPITAIADARASLTR